ncbi:MAG: outer membrane beta-barrel protein [Myxococcales bacterium]|nr:outer membrane beta-barrel protein [Myxococcales bacterium]
MARHPLLTAALSTLLPLAAHAADDTCLIGEHTGIDPGDARTVTGLVCEELAARGVPVGAPQEAPGDGRVWHVRLNKLGDGALLSLSEESPPGKVVYAQRLQIGDLKESPVAARRLAKAVSRHQPVHETAQVSNMVQEETRAYAKMHGEVLWDAGVVGGFVGGTDTGLAYGFTLGVGYEAASWAIGSDMRFLFATGDAQRAEDGWGDSHEEKSASAFMWGVGARYFFSEGSVSPFVGGGLAFTALSVDTIEAQGDKTGLGAYAAVGVEIFRLHESRLAIDARLDVPFFDVPVVSWSDDSVESSHHLPVSLAVTYAW